MLSGSIRPALMTGALLFAGLGTAQAAYKEITVKDGGVIRGTVTVGKAPAGNKSAGGDGCPAEVPDEAIQGNPGRLASAVVYLKKISKGKAWAKDQIQVVSDQRGCEFKPHITLVGEGGTVRFLNSDSVLHNVSSSSVKNPQFNQGVSPGEHLDRKFSKGHEVIGLKCSVHPFMSGYAVVMSHPYYAVTNGDGQYVLAGVPAGKYNLMVWHPSLDDGEATISGDSSKVSNGKIKDKFELSAGGDVVVNIAFAGGALTGLTPPAVAGGAAPVTPGPAPAVEKKPAPAVEKPAPAVEKPAPAVEKPAPAPKKPSAEKPKKPAQPKPAVTKPAPSPAATTPPPASEKRASTMAPISPQRERTPSQDEARDQHKKEQRGVVALPDNSKRLYLLILIAVLGAFLAPFYGLFGVHESPLLEKLKEKMGA